MASFDENMLRDEELSGGFKPGDPDDETFMLQGDEEYPGELPEFDLREKPSSKDEQETLEENNDIKNETENLESNSINEINEQAGEAHEAELTTEEQGLSMQEAAPEAVMPVITEQSEDITETPVQINSESTVNDSDDIINNLDKLDVSGNDLSGSINDEDLSLLLQSELDRTSERREKADLAYTEQAVSSGDQSADDFKPVDDTPDAMLIDLSNINADRPSTFGQQAIPETIVEIPEEKIIKGIPKKPKEKKPKKVKPVKEKVKKKEVKEEKDKDKERTVIPWWTWAVSAAAIIVLAAIGFSLYQFYLKPAYNYITQKKEVLEKPVPKIEKPVNKTQEVPKINIPVEPQPKTEENSLALKKEEEKPELKIEREIVKPKPIHIFVKPSVAKKPKPHLASITKSENREKPYDFHTKESLGTFFKTNQAQFAVQIYTSLSKDDAEEWLMRLKNKNINNAFLSTQRIRNRIWYRVRFGPFDTREDAEEEARKLGYAQSWVDRVR